MEPNRHLPPDSFERFGALSLTERRALFQHVRSCQRCSVEAARIWRLSGSVPTTKLAARVSLDSVLARVDQVEGALTWERDRAPELLKELDQHPQPRRQTLVRNSRRFWLWGLAELLLVRSSTEVFNDPGRAMDLAELALEITQRLDGASYGAAVVADFQGRAWKAVGNARRVVSDLRGSEEALVQAQALLAAGTGDPLELAGLDYHWGGLRTAQRRFAEAIAHFDRAHRAYRRFGDTHESGRALIGKAIAVSKNDPHEAIRLQRAALPMIDAVREPRVLLAAKHNLVMDLMDTGQTEEALRMLEELKPSYQRLGERMLLIRLRWVEAQAAQALRDFSLAERAYREVIAAFASQEIPYEAAVASLELAGVLAEQGRTAEIKFLALEMIPIFQALEIQRETIAALLLFRQAAEAETASLGLIQHIAGFLKRAQHDPAARFSPPV